MFQAFQFVAVVCASMFAGAALYINVAEHPARMLLGTQAAVRQWAPSYRRATWMQAPLAMAGGMAGVAVWLAGGSGEWLLAAVLIGAVVPFTFFAIMPTNHRLLAADLDLDSIETQTLLRKWGNLHAVRTVLSILATALYVGLAVWA